VVFEDDSKFHAFRKQYVHIIEEEIALNLNSCKMQFFDKIQNIELQHPPNFIIDLGHSKKRM